MKWIVVVIMVFGMSFLQAQIGLDELQMRDQDQLQIYKDKIPDSTYKWYWGVGYTDDESIQDAIHKAEMDNPPKEGEIQMLNFIIYYITQVGFDEKRNYIYYNKVGIKKKQ